MMQWINIEQVTIEKIYEKGGLWVVEVLPPKGKLNVNLYETNADTEDSDLNLVQRWIPGNGCRNRQEWLQAFDSALQFSGPSALVIHDAHRLSAATLKAMPMFTERFAPVLLVGDVLKIGSKVVDDREFMSAASFCVKTENENI